MAYTFLCESVKRHEAKIINCRSTKNLNLDDLKNDFRTTELTPATPSDIETLYTHWKTKITEVLGKHLPSKKMRVRKVDVPYMNSEWKSAVRKKRKYSKEFSKDKSDGNWELMRKWRNEATRLRRKAIKDYWKGISQELEGNPRKFFSTFTPFFSAKRKNEDATKMYRINKDATKMYRINARSQRSSEAISLVGDAIGGYSSISMIHKRNPAKSFHFRKVDRGEVLRALKAINPHKATGHDNLPPSALKLVAQERATSLTSIFNQVIQDNTWPQH